MMLRDTRPSILVINPNSNVNMTDSLRSLLQNKWSDAHINFFTAPSGPESINNDNDGQESLTHCISALLNSQYLNTSDAFVVACYSRHPLVPWLEEQLQIQGRADKLVTGIFQASVWQSLQLLSQTRYSDNLFGIVSTGDYWQTNLTHNVATLNGSPVTLFGGVSTTGLSAKELHDLSNSQVAQKMNEATKRLLRRNDKIRVICLGCAGMAGLDNVVRQACVEEMGPDGANNVHIVDGCVAALSYLQSKLE